MYRCGAVWCSSVIYINYHSSYSSCICHVSWLPRVCGSPHCHCPCCNCSLLCMVAGAAPASWLPPLHNVPSAQRPPARARMDGEEKARPRHQTGDWTPETEIIKHQYYTILSRSHVQYDMWNWLTIYVHIIAPSLIRPIYSRYCLEAAQQSKYNINSKHH